MSNEQEEQNILNKVIEAVGTEGGESLVDIEASIRKYTELYTYFKIIEKEFNELMKSIKK